MSAARILDRLDRPKATGPGRWLAGCPCCQSRRGRPISVREIDERVLLHPFCGCTVESVLGALGLQLADLFDRPLGHHVAPSKARIPARDLLEAIGHETNVAVSLLEQCLDGRQSLDAKGWERLATAARRIGAARSQHVD
jgi:hypothetical protein